MTNEQIQQQAERCGHAIQSILPEGLGFAVVVFDREGWFAAAMNSDTGEVAGKFRALLKQWDELVADGYFAAAGQPPAGGGLS